jgi:hypothetical protein
MDLTHSHARRQLRGASPPRARRGLRSVEERARVPTQRGNILSDDSEQRLGEFVKRSIADSFAGLTPPKRSSGRGAACAGRASARRRASLRGPPMPRHSGFHSRSFCRASRSTSEISVVRRASERRDLTRRAERSATGHWGIWTYSRPPRPDQCQETGNQKWKSGQEYQ